MNSADLSTNPISPVNFPEDFKEAEETTEDHDNKEQESSIMDEAEALNSALKELGLLQEEATKNSKKKKNKKRYSQIKRSKFSATDSRNQWGKFKDFIKKTIEKIKKKLHFKSNPPS